MLPRLGLIALLLVSCEKVPLVDVDAGFGLADVTWFEEEQTLFFFYHVEAAQGLQAEHSVVEVSYTTDDGVQDWIRVDRVNSVHQHVPVSCGANILCGSTSVHVQKPPRNVGIRLRYHEDGAMTLLAPAGLNFVRRGPAHSHRSFVVYGVFDETNTWVQWRGRHQFPAIRNEDAQALGLRRAFTVNNQLHGAMALVDGNPYAYGALAACPTSFATTNVASEVSTSERAAWNDVALTLDTASSSTVCALTRVFDALGPFDQVGVARKNPQVQPAFPLLRSPIKNNTSLAFLLAPCNRTISSRHREMQEQRIQLGNGEEVCIDNWQDASFTDDLAALLLDRVDVARTAGRDMVLTLALHHDYTNGGFQRKVEDALALVLPSENTKSSPRVSGAFVFDSYTHQVSSVALRSLVLWCPARTPGFEEGEIPDTAQRSCAISPDDPTLKLGPFSFSTIPILPTRGGYLTFVDQFSEAQAGNVTSLTFRAPERTPISENVAVDSFGQATFFNNEVITAQAEDAFSYCASAAHPNLVFQTPALPDVLPLALLPEVHTVDPQPSYKLGLFWDFPFLLRMNYQTVLAGSATAFSLTVPFGVSNSTQSYLGTELWNQDTFDLTEGLLQCTRFCENPTFDSAGVYNVLANFRYAYANACYRPRFPTHTDGGFPRDP